MEKHSWSCMWHSVYALSVNTILVISMSALQVLIPILSPKFIWSEISQFRGKTTKNIGSAGNCFSGSEVLLPLQDRFGESAIRHDQSEERLTYLFHTETEQDLVCGWLRLDMLPMLTLWSMESTAFTKAKQTAIVK